MGGGRGRVGTLSGEISAPTRRLMRGSIMPGYSKKVASDKP